MNPVRARMVDKSEDCPWSSHRANALGEHHPWLRPHTLYRALGTDAPERQCAYRKRCATPLDPDTLRDLRSCLQTGTPLGDNRFRARIEQAPGVKVGYSVRGRPKKPTIAPRHDADPIDLELQKGI